MKYLFLLLLFIITVYLSVAFGHEEYSEEVYVEQRSYDPDLDPGIDTYDDYYNYDYQHDRDYHGTDYYNYIYDDAGSRNFEE